MKGPFEAIGRNRRRGSLAALSAVATLLLSSSGLWGAGVSSAATPAAASDQRVAAESPDVGQVYTDVPPSNPFYSFVQNISMDNIVSGYPCGGTGEPCDAQHRPYYRPGNTVTRAQMSKFVDNGRRNIADAVGNSLVVSTTAPVAISALTRSGGSALIADCLTPNSNCWAVEGVASPGTYPGYFHGGRGLLSVSTNDAYPGVKGLAVGANSAGGEFKSDHGNAVWVDAPTTGSGYFPLMVEGVGDTEIAERIFSGALLVDGNLQVNGSKSGFVVDAMQNVGTTPLEPGDVVVIVGSSAPVNGQIPVVTVRKADKAYDTHAAGVVDQMLYVPDAATKAEYDAQLKALRAARDRIDRLTAAAAANGTKPDLSQVTVPPTTITDQQGTVHALPDATQAAPGSYLNVVTLGAYKAIKVDASFGAIHAGDMLTTSPNPGYAMKADDAQVKLGSVIGKALSDLDTGTGTIPVMVTLK